MNKTKIEWTDYTWNPVTGCKRNCWYCYVKRLKNYNRTPTFHRERLNQPTGVKKPSKIFICSTADLFGKWVPNKWINDIIITTRIAPWHIYQILTKDPKRLQNFKFEENTWLGTTVEDYRYAKRIFDLSLSRHKNLFVSFEPLLTGMYDIPDYLFSNIKWIIIGALTGSKEHRGFKESWIKSIYGEGILDMADKLGIPVFMKNNLKPDWQHKLRQKFPALN